MYAIVEIAGQQFKVEKDKRIFVHRLSDKEGEQVEFNKVLLTDNNGDVNVGMPTIEGAKVTAKVMAHIKGDKVKVFKKKRRKGYQKLNGHRQYFSEIQIEDILLDSFQAEEVKETVSEEINETQVVEKVEVIVSEGIVETPVVEEVKEIVEETKTEVVDNIEDTKE